MFKLPDLRFACYMSFNINRTMNITHRYLLTKDLELYECYNISLLLQHGLMAKFLKIFISATYFINPKQILLAVGLLSDVLDYEHQTASALTSSIKLTKHIVHVIQYSHN